MEHNHPINEINRRAELIGYPVRELCKNAGVNFPTFWRWQQPNANPRLRDMHTALAALDNALQARELGVLAALVQRHPAAALLYLNGKREAESHE